jgi:hypothetical protein
VLKWGTPEQIRKEYPAKSHEWVRDLTSLLKPVAITKEQIKEHEERTVEARKTKIQAAFDRAQLEREFLKELKKEQNSQDVKPKAKKGRKRGSDDEDEDEEDIKGGSRFKTQAEVDAEKKRLDDELKVLARERSGGSSLEASAINVPSCIKKIIGKIAQHEKVEAEFAIKNKTSDVSLGTSKLNYIVRVPHHAFLTRADSSCRTRASLSRG